MRARGRLLLAAAVAAGVVFAAGYYGRQTSESLGTSESSGPTADVRRDGARFTEPVAQPATEALSTQQGQRRAEAQVEATARQRQQTVEEQIRSFTIPIERGLAGMEDVKLPLQPIQEFGGTLRQFAAEVDDPNWSATTETRIFSEISQATGLGAGDVQVDCRATMCRVLVTKPVSAPNPRYRGFDELVGSFGLEPIWLLAIRDENGTPINFAYVRRPEASATPPASQ